MNSLISIIVPVFNVEKYLDRCILSLVDQKYTAIEILLIDDGSTDSSGDICDSWAKKDDRIRVIHKPNGGLSDARNVGVAHAQGQYVGFVDSDDYVAPDMYATLYKNLIDHDAQISICGLYHVYANRTVLPDKKGIDVFDSQEAIRLCMQGNTISVTAVNRIYPISIVRDVPFPVGRTTEDGFTVIDFLSRVEKIVVDYRPFYYYEHREGTLSTRPFGAGSCDVIDAYEHNKELILEKFPDLIELAEFRCFWARFIVLDAMFSPGAALDSACRKKIVWYLRRNIKKILSNRYVGKGRKISALCLMIHVRLYGFVYRMYRRRLGYQS